MSLPEGPSTLPVAQFFQLGTTPYGFLDACRATYGDLFTLRFPGDPPRVVAGSPDTIQALFRLAPDQYRSDLHNIHLNLGEGSFLFADGAPHLERRRMLAPLLREAAEGGLEGEVLRATDAVLDTWTPDRTLRLYDELSTITLDVLLGRLAGPIAGARRAALITHLRGWLAEALSPMMFLAAAVGSPARVRSALHRADARAVAAPPSPTSRLPWRRLAGHKAAVLAILRDEVRAIRAGADDRVDLLAKLARFRDDAGALLPEDELLDQLLTLLVAGHETSSQTLAWTVLALLRHPDAVTRARAELDATGWPDADALGALPWIDACISEAMRLYPVAPAVTRTLTQPLSLGGFDIPAGTIVWPCIYLVQRHAGAWAEPTRFLPDRFLAGRAPANAFVPWGGGHRRCLGIAFATAEMRVTLARILQRVTLTLAPGAKNKALYMGLTVGPVDGVRVNAAPR